MKIMNMKTKYILVAMFAIIASNLVAQENDNGLGETGIVIYTEYSPVLKDANRIQFLPVVVDTIKVNPKFEYNVQPVLFKTSFNPAPITAASLKGEPLKPLDNGLIKIGVGNYLSPLVEVYYNNRREKNFSVGAFAKHHSAFGTIKNVADQKIYTGFNNNLVDVYGKKFLRSSTIGGDISFKSDQIHYYGYNPYVVVPVDFFKPSERSEMEMQRYNRLKAEMTLVSNNSSKNRINFNSTLAYQYFFAASQDNQHKIALNADLNKLVKVNRYGIDAGFVFNRNHVMAVDYNEIYLDLNPYFKHYTKGWQIQLGVNTTGELGGDSVKYHIYPNIYFQHNVSNTIIPYAGFKGYVQSNNMEFASSVNPFINRNNNYQVTNYAQVIDVGLKGNISSKIYFHINGNYSKIDNMAFFVNDTSLILDNKFVMQYTNVERFAGYGEIALNNLGKISLNLKGHYYYYSYIRNREKPWHMPNVDVRLKTNYQYSSKLNFGINADFIGSRYAKEFDSDGDIVENKLKAIIDVSLYGEYRFASNFHTFLNLNNITGQKQYVWNNYMSHGFNVMAGIKYLF
jgi:hypothetical protein